jgi:hypothetical protein
MRTSKCFTTNVSKMESKQFEGIAAKNVSGGIRWKIRIAKIASTFTVEARAIGLRVEIVEKIDREQNFVIFLDSESVLKGISNI